MAELAGAPLVTQAQMSIVRMYREHYNHHQVKERVLDVLDQVKDDTSAMRQEENFKKACDLTKSWQKQPIDHVANQTSIEDLKSIQEHASLAIKLVTDPMDKLVAIGMLIHAKFHYTVLTAVTTTTTTTDGTDNDENTTTPSRAFLQAKHRAQNMFQEYMESSEELKSAAQEEMEKKRGFFFRRRAGRVFQDKNERRNLLIQFARLAHSVYILPTRDDGCNEQHPRFPLLEEAAEQVARNNNSDGSSFWVPTIPETVGPYAYANLRGHNGFVWCCSVFENDEGHQQLVSGGFDRALRVWDLSTRQCTRELMGHTNSVRCCAVSDSEGQKHLVAGGFDNTLLVWDLGTGDRICNLVGGHIDEIRCCAVFEKGRKLVGGSSSDNALLVWDLRTEQYVCKLTGHTDTIFCCAAFETDAGHQQLVSGGSDKTLLVWDLVARECTKKLMGHKDVVRCCAVFDGGQKLVSGSNDKTLLVWDLVADGGRKLHKLKGHTGFVLCCTVFDEGRKLVSGSDDKTLRVWDLGTGKCTRELMGHTNSVRCCAVFNGGRRLVSGCDDGTLKLWDDLSGYD